MGEAVQSSGAGRSEPMPELPYCMLCLGCRTHQGVGGYVRVTLAESEGLDRATC